MFCLAAMLGEYGEQKIAILLLARETLRNNKLKVIYLRAFPDIFA